MFNDLKCLENRTTPKIGNFSKERNVKLNTFFLWTNNKYKACGFTCIFQALNYHLKGHVWDLYILSNCFNGSAIILMLINRTKKWYLTITVLKILLAK